MFDFISNLRTLDLRNLNLRIFDLIVFTVRISPPLSESSSQKQFRVCRTLPLRYLC